MAILRQALLGAIVSAALVVGADGQEAPGQALPNLIRGNERLGRGLLERVHRSNPDRNVAVSPISVSLILAALQTNADGVDIRREIGTAMGWGEYPNLTVPSRMLLVAFEKLDPLPEAAWISNSVLYRGSNTLSDRFMSSAEKYFGMTFASTGASKPGTASSNDFLVNSRTHLRTAWKGNTFSLSKPFKGEFETAPGRRKVVELLTSEVSTYRYAKTEAFEAVVLPCNRAYLLAVLPAPGHDLVELVRELAASPEAIDAALKRQAGTVTMPPFRIAVEANLRHQLEEMGIRQAFKDLGNIINIPGSRLTEINQRVNIHVDQNGITADAETVAGGIYGGIMAAPEPFSMRLNRPFVFLIRDSTTDALLFLGAVVDPGLN